MGSNSERLFFINVVYGYILKIFYSITNDVNWYLWFMLFLSLISVITICVIFAHRINSTIISTFITVLINVILGKQLYNLLQFTKLASVLMIAGFFIICSAYEVYNRKKRLALVVIGVILFVTGYMIRSESFLLLLPFLGIYAFCEIIHIYKKNSTASNSLLSEIIKFIILFIVTFIGILAVYMVDYYIQKKPEEWNDYWKYQQARAELVDNGTPVYDAFPELYESIGWTEEDINLFLSWISIDDTFSYDKIKTVSDFKASNEEIGFELNNVFFNDFYELVYENCIKTFKYWYIYLIILAFVFFLTDYMGIILVLSEVLIMLFEYSYLVYIYRVEWRVSVSMWMAFILLSGLYLVNHNNKDRLRNVLLKKKALEVSVLVLTLIFAIDRVQVLLREFTEYKKGQVVYRADNPCADFIDYTINDENCYYVDTMTFYDINRSVWDIKGDKSELGKKYVSMGGWQIPSPMWNEYFDNNTPELKDLYEKDNVYFLSSSDTVIGILDLLNEKYDVNIAVMQVGEFEGINVWKYYIDETEE